MVDHVSKYQMFRNYINFSYFRRQTFYKIIWVTMFTFGFFTILVQTGLTHLMRSAKNVSTTWSGNTLRLLFYGKGTPVYLPWRPMSAGGLHLVGYKSGL